MTAPRTRFAFLALAALLGGCCSAAASVRGDVPARVAAPPTSNGPGLPVPGALPSPPPAQSQAPEEIPGSPGCSAAYRCCLAFVETMAPGAPEARSACDQIRTVGTAPEAEGACAQMMAAWAQSLESMGRPVPAACR